ncbi:nuclear transport factor 2 family protein [Roseateles saccharophilus]|uniref:SnoaL-like protein n=1 Tax=Roseateles saccharophilus TaxID=304 RepID=A0A4R3VKW0_ROSSA|nr:nuclear transport factor 2 family protein [Roseateles saccharophilus]MDG0831374.1 nuclear transport factor 2 family protein [Roseateles saccharophilus]TCV04504.1 SnoaL-like protein [Roseateles saccharophilus]
MTHPIDAWHELAKARNPRALAALLAEDVVFHSPVVHTPQRGRALATQYLAAALAVLGNESFRYVREIRGERDALLEFELELAGVQVNGVDIIRWNDAGRITDFKVMVRPLKGMQAVQQKMAELLAQMQQQQQQ